MDEITHTILPNSGGNWGGTALGADSRLSSLQLSSRRAAARLRLQSSGKAALTASSSARSSTRTPGTLSPHRRQKTPL